MVYLQISVDKCTKDKLARKGVTNTTCASDDEIHEVIDVSDLLVATSSDFFEEDEFNRHPTRSVLKTYFFNIKAGLSVGADLNIMRNKLI